MKLSGTCICELLVYEISNPKLCRSPALPGVPRRATIPVPGGECRNSKLSIVVSAQAIHDRPCLYPSAPSVSKWTHYRTGDVSTPVCRRQHNRNRYRQEAKNRRINILRLVRIARSSRVFGANSSFIIHVLATHDVHVAFVDVCRIFVNTL